MRYLPILKESIRSGTIAALVMMPFGYLFKLLGQRVGHYGPKLATLLFGEQTSLILFAQHLVIGWLSAFPLILILLYLHRVSVPTTIGAAYGAAYYVAVNSLALPLFFGDPTPWQIGFKVIYPSLIVHIIFGASIGFTAKKFVAREIEGALLAMQDRIDRAQDKPC